MGLGEEVKKEGEELEHKIIKEIVEHLPLVPDKVRPPCNASAVGRHTRHALHWAARALASSRAGSPGWRAQRVRCCRAPKEQFRRVLGPNRAASAHAAHGRVRVTAACVRALRLRVASLGDSQRSLGSAGLPLTRQRQCTLRWRTGGAFTRGR